MRSYEHFIHSSGKLAPMPSLMRGRAKLAGGTLLVGSALLKMLGVAVGISVGARLGCSLFGLGVRAPAMRTTAVESSRT